MNSSQKLAIAFVVCWCAAVAHAGNADGLLVWPEHPVYGFLERIEALGSIDHAGLETRPLRRSDIARLLADARPQVLQPTDRAWLTWYRAEFTPPKPGRIVSSDGSRLEYTDGHSFVSVGPSMHFAATGYSPGGDVTRWRDFGIEGFGRIGPWFFVDGTAHAITQSGDRLGPPAANSPDRGFSGWTSNDTQKAYYFDTSEGYISLAWAGGGIWLGRFPHSWGPGYRGQIFLSDKPPSMPAVVLMLKPWNWLSYRFVAASIESGIIDSATYRNPRPGEYFTRYYGKHFVAQRVEVWPSKKLRVGLGESVVYGASGIELGYVNPFVDLLHVQHADGGRDNAQFDMDATLYWPRYTVLYGALFVDELKTGVMFDADRNRNWIAFQLGVRVADLWGLWPRGMVRLEYTRLNPWVYEHRYPWSTFTNAGLGLVGDAIQYPSGYWLGQNADDLFCRVGYDLPGRVRLTFDLERTRKGKAVTVADQPYDGPAYRATPFLSGPVTRKRRVRASLMWQTYRRMIVEGGIGYESISKAGATHGEWNARVAFRWGAW